jgi:putative membrane protein
VPYEWVRLGTERNHYDRIVHFSFGLLMAYPIREVFHRVAHARGFWGYYLPLDVTLAFSALYEVLEWLFATVAAPEQGTAFLGSQGDPFDAVKDMALAGTGAALTMGVTALIGWRFNRDFWREWRASLRVRRTEPRGEVTLARWRRGR